ncbi:hypothetical protein RUM44_001153 [Polyplax serrata]|uniref:non-specific serine/threonine protein kinase n=1 Tax=Polyplax serrata TaxID=468196 RepID=A0ABR1B9R0_POLSC
MSLPTVCYLYDSSMSSLSQKKNGRKKRGGKIVDNRIPAGDVLTDSAKKEWIIHSSIARGGFGEIYTASCLKEKQQNYVIKIEPSENGPLFCEKTVYIRIGKQEDIKQYMKLKGLKTLGMPQFYGCGIHNSDGKKFRFLVMDRYGKDLWSIFLEQNRIFPPATVYKVAIQVLDVLEYMHSKGYVHADIKGANLLLGRQKGTENQVYLVDFGLAARYTNVPKADPRRAHNGTIEYTSRDGHEGIVTRRGDIEVLGYNILQWVSSNLPWELTKDINEVQALKIKHMKDCHLLLKICFEQSTPTKALEKYFIILQNMKTLDEPDYNLLRSFMREGIAKTGDVSNKLEFTMPKKSRGSTPKTPVAQKPRKLNNRRQVSSRRTQSAVSKEASTTCDLTEMSSEECEDSDEEFDDEDEDIFIQSTPEKKKKKLESPVKRSWKDCPSVVACAELLLNDDRTARRTRRNK